MSDLFGDDDNGQRGSDFARMFEDSLGRVAETLAVGDRVRGEILSIGKEEVFVSTGTVNDGVVLRRELLDANGNLQHKVGDVLDLFVTQTREDRIFLSTNPTAKNIAEDLEDAFDMMLPVEGRVTETCNGGFRVNIHGKTAFCPISQMDVRRIEDGESYVGQKFEFLITKFEGGRNLVVSRRKILEEQEALSRTSFMDDHKGGDFIQGVVTRLERFGAFVEVAPGVDGLVHISELSWSRVENPADVVRVGQEVSAKILKIEEEGTRLKISLSLKQAQAQPWDQLPDSIQRGQIVEGRVVRCLQFGAFVEVAPGIEGLVALSEMSSTKRVTRSNEVFKEGDTIRVLIKDVRPDERKLLLSYKDAEGRASGEGFEDPEQAAWQDYSSQTAVSMGTLGDQFKTLFTKK